MTHTPEQLESMLKSMPRAQVPAADLSRVRMQVLDRISLPQSMQDQPSGSGFMAFLPRIVRITGGVVGGLVIMMSVSVGAAVATSESLPGQPMYPLKKLTENVRLQLARSEEHRASLQIKFANNRIDELETILKRQRQGKISEAELQEILAETTKDLQETGQTVSEAADGSKVGLLSKIVDLSNKQTAVIQAAQVESQGEVKAELEKALASTQITKEQAIENIEKAGLVVEEQPLTLEDPDSVNPNEVSSEGRLTAVTSTSVNIGTVRFLLTADTEYVNITSVDLKVGARVKVTGEVVNKQAYAVKIEQVSPTPTPEPTPTPTPSPSPTPTDSTPEPTATPTPADTVPAEPAD